MATLTIRKLDDEVYSLLGERAKRNNRSLEAEVREILRQNAASFDLDKWLNAVADLRRNSNTGKGSKTSLDILREDRNDW